MELIIRVTIKSLRSQVWFLQHNNYDISLSKDANGVRFCNFSGDTNLSDRFKSNREALAWLNGFIACIRHRKINISPLNYLKELFVKGVFEDDIVLLEKLRVIISEEELSRNKQ